MKLYLIWTLIYTPLELYYAYTSGIPLIKELLLYIRGLVLVGQHYNSWPLWYLLSTIYALMFARYLKKKRVSNIGVFVSSIVVMIISFGCDYFVSLKNLSMPFNLGQKVIMVSIGNGRILQGLFYIPLGIILSYNSTVPLSFILFAIGFIGNCLVDGFWGSVLLSFSSIGLFGIITKIKLPYRPRAWKYLRESSMVIYFVHMYIWTFYYILIYGEKTFGMDSFIATAIFSVFVSGIYLLTKEQFKIKDWYKRWKKKECKFL